MTDPNCSGSGVRCSGSGVRCSGSGVRRSVNKFFSLFVFSLIFRGYSARKFYVKRKRAIVLLQSCVRRMYAKRELKKLKVRTNSRNCLILFHGKHLLLSKLEPAIKSFVLASKM